MEDKESKLPADLAMDGEQRKKGKERVVIGRRKRKGTPRRLVHYNESFPTSEGYFSDKEDLNLKETSKSTFGVAVGPISGEVLVNTGEDIIAKITSFCERYSCNAYVFSAVGSIARANILGCGNASLYEGSYRIVSLTGHVSVSLNCNASRIFVNLADNEDSIFGGYVSGPLIAATDVHIELRGFNDSSLEEPTRKKTSSQGSSSASDFLENEVPPSKKSASQVSSSAKDIPENDVPPTKKTSSQGSSSAKDFPENEVPPTKKTSSQGSSSAKAFQENEVPPWKIASSQGSSSAKDFLENEVPPRKKASSQGSSSAKAFLENEVPSMKKTSSQGSSSAKDFPENEVPPRKKTSSQGSSSASNIPETDMINP